MAARGKSVPEPAGDADLRRTTSDRVRGGLEKRIAALRREEEAVRREADVAAVHRMRVASRRVREALSLSATVIGRVPAERLERSVRQVTRGLGRLRETQVSVALLAEIGQGSSGAAAIGFDYLQCRLARTERRELEAARRALGRADLGRLERRLGEAMAAVHQQPLDLLGGEELLRPRLDEAEERLGAVRADPGDDGRVHQLRIAVKRLRYAIELLAPEDSPSREPLLARLRALQDGLGVFHDVGVLVEWAGRRADRLRARERPALARTVTAAARRLAGQRAVARRQAMTLVEQWPAGSFRRRCLRAVRPDRAPRAMA